MKKVPTIDHEIRQPHRQVCNESQELYPKLIVQFGVNLNLDVEIELRQLLDCFHTFDGSTHIDEHETIGDHITLSQKAESQWV